MSILPICITGEPVLHRAAAPIESFDSELSDLVADMIETMHAAPGVGLAAPQVGVGSQVFVWRYGGSGSFDIQYRDVLQLDEGPARGFNTALHGVVVNPTLDLVWDTEGAGAILPEEPDVALESEGCLSVPGGPARLRHRRQRHRGQCARMARAHLPARIRPPAGHPLRRPSRGTLRRRGPAGHRRARMGRQRTHVDPGGAGLGRFLPGSRYVRVSGPGSPTNGSSCGPPRWPRAWGPSCPPGGIPVPASATCPCPAGGRGGPQYDR